jgi:hypothetical protein
MMPFRDTTSLRPARLMSGVGCRWICLCHQSSRDWWSVGDLVPVIEDSPGTASDTVRGPGYHSRQGWFGRTVSAPLKTGEESRMREPYGEDPASHPDPGSCAGTGDGAGDALTGAHAGPVSSCEFRCSGVPTRLSEAEGHTGGRALGERPPDPAQSETRCMRGNSTRGKREIPQLPTGLVPRGRPGKVIGRTPGGSPTTA